MDKEYVKKEYRDQKTELGRSGNGRPRFNSPHYKMLNAVLGDRPACSATGAVNSATAMLESRQEDTTMEQTSTEPTDIIMLDKPSDQEPQTVQCSDCGCSFSQPQSDSDPVASNAAASPDEQVSKSGTPPKCPACQEGNSLSNGRRPHRRIRLDPHSCNMCSKTFISSAHLNLHLASHNKERRFRCSTCGKYFHQTSHLMAHKLIHSGDRPFKCPDCGKTFGRASHLKTHQRLHTGEKPFKCTYCEKSFTQKAGLLAHVRLHTGEKPFKCEQCGEGFRILSALLSHKAQEASAKTSLAPPPPVHPQPQLPAPAPAPLPTPSPASAATQPTPSISEDIKCGVCCRTFVRSSYIRLHIHLSKGQRPYHCRVCNKTFVKLDTFANHCDKHLRQKREKNKEVKSKVVKPPLFTPLPLPSTSESSLLTQPQSANIKKPLKTKTKIKTEP